MTFDIPALEFAGEDPARLPSLGRVLRDPLSCWPPEVLHRPFMLGRSRERRVALIAEPRATSEILLDRDGSFPRSRLHQKILGTAYGENLVRGTSLDWRRQRREIAQPMSSERAQMLVPRLEHALARMVAEWRERAEGEPLDLLLDARRLTLDMLWRSFFCTDEAARTVEPMVEEAALALEAEPEAVDQLRNLGALAGEALRRQAFRRADLGPGEEIDINTVRLFLHTGHDNAAPTLAWALWLLAVRPEWQARARAEWRQGAPAGRIDSASYPVTAAVLRETLRLFPPIMQLARDVEAPVEVAGERLEADFTALMNLYVMHRSRLWWEDPDGFDPGRFLGGGDETKRRLLWLPFGTGPRACIGAAFAQVALTLSLGRLLGAFELLPNPDAPLRCRADWALRPEGRGALLIRRLT